MRVALVTGAKRVQGGVIEFIRLGAHDADLVRREQLFHVGFDADSRIARRHFEFALTFKA